MKLIDNPVEIKNGKPEACHEGQACSREKTIAYRILEDHNKQANDGEFHIKFDSLTSHDITYVGIIQTARASGLKEFPVPYVLTNCHNTLCAVGGTINEDDHQFALSCAHKYGGIYVPPNMAVIHSFNREMMARCGGMILGSDSHTRYGALGCLGIGEGGGEVAKQLLSRTYDIKKPPVVLVYLTGELKPGVGPHDVALALIAATYDSGFVKNAIIEFAGPGIANLSQETRNAIDVMTTETTCLSSVWETDCVTENYFASHGRSEEYKSLSIIEGAVYDRCIELDLSEVECMIALPMHPSLAVEINELKSNPEKFLGEATTRVKEQLEGAELDLTSKISDDGKIIVDQGIIAGCSGGTYGNIMAAASILKGHDTGNAQFRLSVYPDSMPVYEALVKNGTVLDIVNSGAVFRECFCGPCFGAGDTPANGELSIRHTTRNFPNREGSKPGEGQMCGVALMDARSIAATAVNQGVLTAASDICDDKEPSHECDFDDSTYKKRVYWGFGKAECETPLKFGPNIKDWPEQPELSDNLLIKIVSHIDDDVTTTDELIPSGETSSFRSNPLRLAEFALSRRDPEYVGRAKDVCKLEFEDEEITALVDVLKKHDVVLTSQDTNICSAIFAKKPGDGSAREQAASCQRVLGGGANFAIEYATKRYRSNCINWGMVPFLVEDGDLLPRGVWVAVCGIREAIDNDAKIEGLVINGDNVKKIDLEVGDLGDSEKDILKSGCLINYYKAGN